MKSQSHSKLTGLPYKERIRRFKLMALLQESTHEI